MSQKTYAAIIVLRYLLGSHTNNKYDEITDHMTVTKRKLNDCFENK